MGGAAIAGAVVMAVSTAVEIAGKIQEGNAAAKQARENQLLANHQAADAVQRGATDVGLSRMQTSQLIGQQKVAYAASGVDTSVGTPAQAMDYTRAMGEVDAATLRNNAAREAWGYRTQGLDYGMASSMAKQRAAYGAAGSGLAGLGSILGTAGKWGGS